MVDYNELRRKFRPRGKAAKKTSSKASVRAIAREYEIKKAALGGPPSLMRKGPLFFGFVVLVLAVLGYMVVSAARNGVGFGKARIERKPLQAKQSMRALSVALGRYGHGAVAFRQVAYVADRAFYDEAVAEVFADRLGFCGRFDYE